MAEPVEAEPAIDLDRFNATEPSSNGELLRLTIPSESRSADYERSPSRAMKAPIPGTVNEMSPCSGA